MRRLMSSLLITASLMGGALSMTGCIVEQPRPYAHRVWVAGYWGPQHVWVGGRWVYR